MHSVTTLTCPLHDLLTDGLQIETWMRLNQINFRREVQSVLSCPLLTCLILDEKCNIELSIFLNYLFPFPCHDSWEATGFSSTICFHFLNLFVVQDKTTGKWQVSLGWWRRDSDTLETPGDIRILGFSVYSVFLKEFWPEPLTNGVETNQFGFNLIGQKGIAIMTGPLQLVLYYFSWFTATFCVCVANLFEME
jgi:hypothetical protein